MIFIKHFLIASASLALVVSFQLLCLINLSCFVIRETLYFISKWIAFLAAYCIFRFSIGRLTWSGFRKSTSISYQDVRVLACVWISSQWKAPTISTFIQNNLMVHEKQAITFHYSDNDLVNYVVRASWSNFEVVVFQRPRFVSIADWLSFHIITVIPA